MSKPVLKLARKVLKLNNTADYVDPELKYLSQGYMANPHDLAYRGVIADWLTDHDHPMADIFRWYHNNAANIIRNASGADHPGTIDPRYVDPELNYDLNNQNAWMGRYAIADNIFRTLGKPVSHLLHAAMVDNFYPYGESSQNESNIIKQHTRGHAVLHEMASLGIVDPYDLDRKYFHTPHMLSPALVNERSTEQSDSLYHYALTSFKNRYNEALVHHEPTGKTVFNPNPDPTHPKQVLFSSQVSRARQVLRLAAAKATNNSDMAKHIGFKWGPPPEEYSTAPEMRYFGGSASVATRKEAADLGNAATDPRTYDREKKAELAGTVAHKLNTVVPTTNTVEQFAQFGKSAKGEYHNAFETAKDLFGWHPHGLPAWVAINAALSPSAAYPDHASAASHITANWLALPNSLKKDEHSIRKILDEATRFGKNHNPEMVESSKILGPDGSYGYDPEKFIGMPGGGYRYTDMGQGNDYGTTTTAGANKDRVVRLLQNIEEVKKSMEDPGNPENLMGLDLFTNKDAGAKAGMLKVPNFFTSYATPEYGAALDTHMARLLMHPGLGQFLSTPQILNEFMRQISPKDGKRLTRLIQKNAPTSELIKEILKHEGIDVYTGKIDKDGKKEKLSMGGLLKNLNISLLNKPQYYAAYKHAVADAAKKLGWKVSEVQESVWTGLVAAMAANGVYRDTGGTIPMETIQQHLTDANIAKGWSNNEFFHLPTVASALNRAGVGDTFINSLAAKTARAREEASRPGILRQSYPALIRHYASYLPGSSNRIEDAASPIRKAIIKSLRDAGYDVGKLRFAKYDALLPIDQAMQRATSANNKTFLEHLGKVLMQSGVMPQEISPAIHDVGGATRVSIFAAGQYKNPNAPLASAAWTGMLGRQPGMLSFQSNPNGQDSIYKFDHGDTAVIQRVLDSVGIRSRVIVPNGKMFTTYIYDQGRKSREAVASAAAQLRSPVDEWRGQGTPLGGDKKDMGRSQYRDVINASESSGAMQ